PQAPPEQPPEAGTSEISTNPVPTPTTTAPAVNIVAARIYQMPEAHVMERLYPRDALRRGDRGRATVTCRVGLDGHLSACSVDRETPEDRGFGRAAVRLAEEHTTAFPEEHDGERVDGGSLHVTYTFVPSER